MALGKLQKVDLRKAWKHEAQDFTTWLAEEENLSLLGDEIDMNLRVIQTEASVGKFSVDILAEDIDTGRKIIIENQLETTNHDHLGKVITYAAGFDAEVVIWIVKDVRDEHKQAIDWLNDHTDRKIGFFIIKMELYQISGSPPAPKFQVVSEPNEWAKELKQSAEGQLTETKMVQLDFWTKFKEYVQAGSSKLRLRTPRAQHWYNIACKSSELHISLTINTQENKLGCAIYIPDSKETFHELREHKAAIEKELAHALVWMPLEGKKASRIILEREGDLEHIEKWEQYFEWFKLWAEKFQAIFPKYTK